MPELRAYRRALIIMGGASGFLLCVWSVLILTWLPAQEFLHQYYRPLLWAGLIPGIVASATFLIIHRPSKWLAPAALNSAGWVIVILLLYIRSAISLALQHNSLLWRGPGNALNALGFIVAIDLLLIYRVISFLQYRMSYRRRRAEIVQKTQVDRSSSDDV